MTHFPDELIEAARAMYRSHGIDFDKLSQARQVAECQAFSAGLRSFMPVSDGILDSMFNTLPKEHEALLQAQFTALITYLTGDGN